MYKKLLRPLLFSLQPEKVHHLLFNGLKTSFKIPGVSHLFKATYDFQHKSLEKKLFGLKFKNPVGLAAGLDKNAEYIDELSAMGFGFIEIGTLTPKPQDGNPKPRLFRLTEDEGIINRMGFNNDGVETAIKRLRARKSKVIIGGNIGKNKVTPNEEAFNDYKICFEALFPYVDYFTLNISSPNTPNLRELQEKEPLKKLLSEVQKLNQQKKKPKPLLLKIAPDLSDSQLDDILEIVKEIKLDGIIATNTTIDRSKLKTPLAEVQKIGMGGLSGKPLRKKSTEIIRYLHDKSKGSIPIIGVGGIHSAEDAIEKIKAGASLIQIYTGFIYNGPELIKKINKQLVKENI